MMTENMTLDNDTRQELANYAVEMLYDHLYDTVMRSLSKLEESDRFYNWYHGYTQINLPLISSNGRVIYRMWTAASSGSVPTQYFGEEFDADKVETNLLYTVYVGTPASVRNNRNVTLHIDVEKVSLEDLSSGEDRVSQSINTIKETHTNYNYSPPRKSAYSFTLSRKVLPADVGKQKLDMMPGFRVRWHYSGMEVEPWAKYYNEARTMAFVRHYSNIFISFKKLPLKTQSLFV